MLSNGTIERWWRMILPVFQNFGYIGTVRIRPCDVWYFIPFALNFNSISRAQQNASIHDALSIEAQILRRKNRKYNAKFVNCSEVNECCGGCTKFRWNIANKKTLNANFLFIRGSILHQFVFLYRFYLFYSWFVALRETFENEKMIQTLAVFNSFVIFATFSPQGVFIFFWNS